AYFIRRSLWLRNVALGIPIHRADFIYAFDEYSYTLYLYVLAFLQVLAGFAPYGLHLVGAVMYLGGVVILYRLVRPAYGALPAMGGLLVLCFLPTLFAWSVSALKEPPFLLLGAAAVATANGIVRTRSVLRRIGGVIFLVGFAAG